jgi:hypothetical protein
MALFSVLEQGSIYSEETTRAVAAFEKILAESGKFMETNFKNGKHCVICDFTIENYRHCRTESHLRRALLLRISQLGHEIMRVPNTLLNAQSLKELYDVLVTKKSGTDFFLFDTQGARWSEQSKVGPHESRGMTKDISKIWFLVFLEILKQRCEMLQTSTQDHGVLGMISDIITTIDSLKSKTETSKRRTTNPCAPVV